MIDEDYIIVRMEQRLDDLERDEDFDPHSVDLFVNYADEVRQKLLKDDRYWDIVDRMNNLIDDITETLLRGTDEVVNAE